MKKTLTAVLVMVAGSALADPAPVSSVNGSSLEQRIGDLERMLEARNEAQISLLQKVNSLQQDVADLRGITEEHAYRLEQLLQRQRELYKEIDRRLSAAPAAGVNNNVSVDTRQLDNGTSSSQSSTTNQVNYSANLSENEAYDHAIKLVLEDKRYDAAIPEFREFIKRFPQSTYIPNAHYWLGQLLFAKGEYDAATSEFKTVVDEHPDSNKRGDCLLKLGVIAEQQQNNDVARSFYQQVVEQYGDSTEAGLAKKRLSKL
ncbi:tol-pal system protein YbgF [Idiomarina xiamenensis]|uniref:Cell division coordinator CpoB n=1 Tax=Idiomarina xiamenensis 10-D-4 TaxID=740709 RepID=K2JZC0_9GAMM|nr:tol-pal system protein YbgF [Idiomarina xiamenensis]EKE80783.1 hypothetical protein A10D4_11234 [Idiomarina xiamenensis 10-D-4]